MRCNNCGVEIDHVLVNTFQWDGTDREESATLEDYDGEVYGIMVDHNWTGDGLDDEDAYHTILCPNCRKFPFKSKEIGRQEVVYLTFFN